MAKYHYNVYPIYNGGFSYALDELKDFYRDTDSRFPILIGDAHNRYELKFLLKSLPENCTYMVLNSNGFSVWVLPSSCSYPGIKYLINNGHIDLNRVSRDVGYYELPQVLDDLPYNYHYIIQRYYE